VGVIRGLPQSLDAPSSEAQAIDSSMSGYFKFHSAREERERERGTQTDVYKPPLQQGDAPSSEAQEEGALRRMKEPPLILLDPLSCQAGERQGVGGGSYTPNVQKASPNDLIHYLCRVTTAFSPRF